MAEELDDDRFDTNASRAGQQQTTGQQHQQPSMSNQAIDGNDSESGSDTTLSQRAEFDQSSGPAGGQNATCQSQRQPHGSRDAPTLDQYSQAAGAGDLGNASDLGGGETGYGDQDGPSVDTATTGEGFIGSQGSGSDDYPQERGGQSDSASSASTTGGSDFAEQGQGSLDENYESGSGSTGGGSGMNDRGSGGHV